MTDMGSISVSISWSDDGGFVRGGNNRMMVANINEKFETPERSYSFEIIQSYVKRQVAALYEHIQEDRKLMYVHTVVAHGDTGVEFSTRGVNAHDIMTAVYRTLTTYTSMRSVMIEE